MANIETSTFSIPAHVTQYLESLGYEVPYSSMGSYIQLWDTMLKCKGEFWAWEQPDGSGKIRKVQRMTVHPAKRVCKEMASLIMDGDMRIFTESEECNEWLDEFLGSKGFIAKGQDLVAKGCGLGTAAWVLWLNAESAELQIRRMDARMIVPLSWDEDGITECAFVTRAKHEGKSIDQLQVHYKSDGGNYFIGNAFFDIENGDQINVEGFENDFDTQGQVPWFAVFTPSGDNDLVDFSPYGRSIFADSVDILKSVDIAWDAEFGEVKTGKRLIFVSDSMIQVGVDANGQPVYKAFTDEESGMYRMVGSMDDMVQDFAPGLRVDGFSMAYKDALSAMGDSMGFGADYFVPDRASGMKTAKEVVSVQSQLMRNIAKNEEKVGNAIEQIVRAVLHCARTFMDVSLTDEGKVSVEFDDSIVEDTDTEKANDQAEVAQGLMPKYRYIMKWQGLSEEEARQWVAECGTSVEPMPTFED